MKKQINTTEKRINYAKRQIEIVEKEKNKSSAKHQALKALLETEDKKEILGGYTTFRKCQRLFSLTKQYQDALTDLSNHLEVVIENEKIKNSVAKID